MQSVTSKVEIRDITTGLWIWRSEHHHWKPGDDWQPIVTSTFVESGGERLVLDPLVPKTAAAVDLMSSAPSPVDAKQLRELHLKIQK